MTREAQGLLERALKLPLKERERLVKSLQESVDEEQGDDPAEVEKAWAKEIRRRLREVREGRVKTIPADEAMAQVHRELEEHRAKRAKKKDRS